MIGPSASTPSTAASRRRWAVAASGVALLGILALLLLVSGRRSATWQPPTIPPEGWNLLLVSLDTTRPDRLAACDGGPVATPALDRIRGGGFLFTQMITPAPNTLPAHASLFTGVNPYIHGVRENTEHALIGDHQTLAERLRDAGYATAAFLAAFMMDRRFGLDQGFELYMDQLTGPEPGLPPYAVELRGEVVARRAAGWIGEYARQKRAGQETRPFFLFVHFFDAHAPYQPPPPHDRRYLGRPYEGELSYQDACLGLVLDALEASGEAARTWIWVISDHGESLGEHGEATHSLFVYDAAIRVVSLLRPPPPEGRYVPGAPLRRTSAPTSLISVPATLLEIAGIPPLATTAGAPNAASQPPGEIEGPSLLPLMEGRTADESPVYCETLSPWISYHWAPLHGVRTPQWKYIRAPESELYDLAADPHELQNVIASHPQVRTRLSDALDRFLSRERGGAAAQRAPSEEERQRLRSLGYVSAEAPRNEAGERPDPKRMVRFFHTRYQEGKNLLYQGRYAEAAEALEAALRLDPLNNSLLVSLGTALREAGRPAAAGRAFRDALRLQPNSPRSWNGWGRALLQQGQADSAVWAHEEARRRMPAAPDPWIGLGDVHVREARYADAAAAYDAALILGGDALHLHGLLARLFDEVLNNPIAAEKHLLEFARLRGVDRESAAAQLPPLP